MLRPRLEGLTDEEYLWEPVPRCWNVRQADSGRWMGDWTLPNPEPPPLTTIAWRMLHVTTVLADRAGAHFGGDGYDYEAGFVGTAVAATERMEAAYRQWKAGLDDLSVEKLDDRSEGPANTIDAQFPFASVIQHVNREVIHHGAEIALLRDLYRHNRLQDPLVRACLAGDLGRVDALLQTDAGALQRVKLDHPDLIVHAVQDRNASAVRLLIDLGFDVNTMNKRAPLHAAAGLGDVQMVKLLIECGADPDALDTSYRSTPLGWAQFLKQTDVADYLSTL